MEVTAKYVTGGETLQMSILDQLREKIKRSLDEGTVEVNPFLVAAIAAPHLLRLKLGVTVEQDPDGDVTANVIACPEYAVVTDEEAEKIFELFEEIADTVKIVRKQ